MLNEKKEARVSFFFSFFNLLCLCRLREGRSWENKNARKQRNNWNSFLKKNNVQVTDDFTFCEWCIFWPCFLFSNLLALSVIKKKNSKEAAEIVEQVWCLSGLLPSWVRFPVSHMVPQCSLSVELQSKPWKKAGCGPKTKRIIRRFRKHSFLFVTIHFERQVWKQNPFSLSSQSLH